MIFSSLIQPYFDYCSVVWDGCGTTLAGKIQKLQNRAARVTVSTEKICDQSVFLMSTTRLLPVPSLVVF